MTHNPTLSMIGASQPPGRTPPGVPFWPKIVDSAIFLVRDPALPATAEADDSYDSDSEEDTPVSHKNFFGPGATPTWLPPAVPTST